MENNVFSELFAVNVNEHTEKKNGLTYLSWAWAWAETKKRYPDAEYTIWKDEQNRPYVFDETLGYMVFTSVTIGGKTHEMWLPVMDNNNKAMKNVPYVVKTRRGDVHVAAATMFDINSSIMRCLTKNLAMFGLGLYIYSGEDLPESVEDEKTEDTAKVEEKPKKAARKAPAKATENTTGYISEDQRTQFLGAIKERFPVATEANAVYKKILEGLGITNSKLMLVEQLPKAMAMIEEM